MDQVNMYVNPLAWWQAHHTSFPRMSFVARQILAILGSAIECERVFSAAGIVTGLLRNSMTPEHLHQVVFLSKNFPFEQELGRLQEAQEILAQFKEQLGASSEPEVVEKALVADELAHQVELDAISSSQRSATTVPYVGLLQRMLDEQGMLGVSDSDSSSDDEFE